MTHKQRQRDQADAPGAVSIGWNRALSRRRLLGLTLTAGGAVAASALLAACGGTSPLSGDTPSTATTASTATSSGGQTPAGTSTQSASGGDDKRSGQIIVGLSQEPTVFNPLMPHIEVDQGVHFSLFSPLWAVDEKGAYFPVLATEVPTVANGGVSEDGLTWRIKLRDGVTWHDGKPFTADDVVFTHELIMRDNFKAASRQGHEFVTDMKAVSPTEVSWTMKRAYAPYLAILASTFIVPKHILGEAADPNSADFNNAPVGTGPFVWSERVAGDHITLKANPDYFDQGPFVEQLIFKYIPDLNVMYTQFKTGEIDYTGLQGITADHYGEAKDLPDRVVKPGPSPFIENIWFNLGKPQFAEQEVREALYYGMDKDTIIKNIYYGLPTEAESYLPKESPDYNPDLPKHQYDPAKAKELLDAAGWKVGSDGVREKNGVKLAFSNSTTAGNQVREQAQAYLQQNWKEIGVALEIKNMPAAVVWGDYWTQSQYDSLMIGLHYGIGPDPDATVYFASSAIPVQGGSGTNAMQYKNPEVDDLLAKASSTMDPDERKQAYQKIQAALRKDLPFLPVFQYANIEGVKKGLTGYVANPNTDSNCWNMNVWKWES